MIEDIQAQGSYTNWEQNLVDSVNFLVASKNNTGLRGLCTFTNMCIF